MGDKAARGDRGGGVRGMWRRALVFAGAAMVLIGCTQPTTYWGFPPGRTAANFHAAEAQCRLREYPLETCLSALGYYPISAAEFAQRQQAAQATQAALEAAKQPVDIVGFDVRTGELYMGVSRSEQPASLRSSIEMSSIDSKISCTGFSEVRKVVPGGKGSTGWAEMLCRDGRKVKGEFVYESASSGYGRGADELGNIFLFKFGRMNMNQDQLREQFRSQLKQEEKQRHEQQDDKNKT
jgi:hypothetical protein